MKFSHCVRYLNHFICHGSRTLRKSCWVIASYRL